MTGAVPTVYTSTGYRTAAAVQIAQEARRCSTCGRSVIGPGDRYLEVVEYPGGYTGRADAAGQPVRDLECAYCAHRCGRGDVLDPSGRETTAVLTLGIVESYARGRPRWQVDRQAGETLTDAAERRIRELATEAEQQTRNGYVLLETLDASHLYDDYQRIRAQTHALAFERTEGADGATEQHRTSGPAASPRR